MPQIVTLCLGVISTSLTAAFVGHCSQDPVSYSKLVVLGFSLFLPLQLVWALIIGPNYFSSFHNIPSAPRVPGLAGFLRPRSSETILEWVDTIPNEGFIRHLDILNTEIIILTEPKMIADFLGVKSYHYSRIPALRRVIERLLGHGLVTSEGAIHKSQRKNLLPAFNVKVIRGLYPLFWTKASDMVSLIKEEIIRKSGSSSKFKLDVEDWAGRVSLDIIGQAGFGSDFAALHNPNTPLNTAYRTAFIPNSSSKLVFLLSLMTSPKFVRLLPFKRNTEIDNGVKAVTTFIKTFIDERKRQMYLNVDDLDYAQKYGQGDIISVAMHSKMFDTESLVDQSKTLLGAGHETSSAAIAFALHHLSQPKNAHIQEKLRQEIRAHLPSPNSGISIDADMIDRLPYLDAVSKEALRVSPPVPMFGRIAIVDTDICGMRIPKGTDVRVHPWAINKAKHLWGDDAREFKPERWLVGKGAANGGADESLAYITFGHGPRGCIGRGFAIAENKALLATLIGSFDFKAIPDSPEHPDIIFLITARIIGGPQVTASIVEGW